MDLRLDRIISMHLRNEVSGSLKEVFDQVGGALDWMKKGTGCNVNVSLSWSICTYIEQAEFKIHLSHTFVDD